MQKACLEVEGVKCSMVLLPPILRNLRKLTMGRVLGKQDGVFLEEQAVIHELTSQENKSALTKVKKEALILCLRLTCSFFINQRTISLASSHGKLAAKGKG